MPLVLVYSLVHQIGKFVFGLKQTMTFQKYSKSKRDASEERIDYDFVIENPLKKDTVWKRDYTGKVVCGHIIHQSQSRKRCCVIVQ
jgi:hypothetical protein